ncbi:chemotaxis protein CheB [Pedobacter petrophilus]|uniref:protein-glutamate methylesterase n=1 Tax=Pedobacter petrophilus TaxID=1908241 RepID=A0A7K0G357_9SPHI|nr:chemotaxis protein CheB [Pedobacter petrophilus]MRX77416.1 chemotaxis protein CheB [Pedobacter petrophilus]
MAETLIHGKCSALVIGGSAGSLDVLLEIFPNLSTRINFPILVVTHRKSGNDSLLTDLLKNRTSLTVQEAEEKSKLLPGYIYIVPADYHLLIENNHTISLDYSEKVNYSRPSIDVTFQSAAEVFRDELVCILLSGSNADGVEGLKIVKKYGGLAVIQNPETAIMPYMPQQALNYAKPSIILDSLKMAAFINGLINK